MLQSVLSGIYQLLYLCQALYCDRCSLYFEVINFFARSTLGSQSQGSREIVLGLTLGSITNLEMSAMFLLSVLSIYSD